MICNMERISDHVSHARVVCRLEYRGLILTRCSKAILSIIQSVDVISAPDWSSLIVVRASQKSKRGLTKDVTELDFK